jgi:hypothetical protein
LVGSATAVVFLVVLGVVAVETAGVPALESIGAWFSSRDAANVLAVSRALRASPSFVLATLVITLMAVVVFTVASARRQASIAFAALFAAAASMIVIIRIVILPGLAQHETSRDFIRAAQAAVGPADAMFFYRTFDYGAVFYSDGHIPIYDGAFPREAPRFLLVSRSQWERLRPRAVNDYEQVRLPVEGEGSRRLVLLRRIRD